MSSVLLLIPGTRLRSSSDAKPRAVQPEQQRQVVPCHPDIQFAAPGPAAGKGKRDLFHRSDPPSNQDLQQQLETGWLEEHVLHAMPANHEKARERISDPGLQGARGQDSRRREQTAKRMPALFRCPVGHNGCRSPGPVRRELRSQVPAPPPPDAAHRHPSLPGSLRPCAATHAARPPTDPFRPCAPEAAPGYLRTRSPRQSHGCRRGCRRRRPQFQKQSRDAREPPAHGQEGGADSRLRAARG